MSNPQVMQNSQHSRVMSLKYKSKYKRLKNRIRNFVFENAALCDEVAIVQSDLVLAREERRYLIKRLLRHETEDTVEEESQPQSPSTANVTKKRGPKKQMVTLNSYKPNKVRAVRTRDKIVLDADGKPMFPINLYNILIHSPGEIISVNPNFHTAQWIYPVGYVATRIYAHPKDPRRKCVFTCKILNNAGMPQFQIIPDNDLDSVFFGESAGGCHLGLLETIQRTLTDVVKLPLKVQGEQFFGLSNPTVKSLMQLDGSFGNCANFKGFTDVTDDSFTSTEEKDPTLNFEALQSLIAKSVYHTMPEVKEEPPDELFDFN